MSSSLIRSQIRVAENAVKRLDWRKQQDVKYAIPYWLRDLYIETNCKKITGRVEPRPSPESPRIAIVGYGPSLRDTWPHLRDFPIIMSCSGATKFLIERGIVPTWHVCVDPLPNCQEKLIGTPHPDVEYLVSSTCRPQLLDFLTGFNVKLWHVYDPEKDTVPVLPIGEWSFRGGCNVGLRAMAIAAFWDYTDQHIFGIDGSEGATGKHADAHPGQAKGYSITEYNGVEYRTTPGFLEAARQTWHELDQMPSVTATFYGEGLVQAMAKDYKRKDPKHGVYAVAEQKQVLISEEYRAMNVALHESNIAYGVGGFRYADIVKSNAAKLNTTSILDYGCGKGLLAKALPFPIWEYDPAIPGKDAQPRPADLVVCTDVLEHVEPDKILYVLDDIRRCTKIAAFLVIHTGDSHKTLPDGRNSHILKRSFEWWLEQIDPFFIVTSDERIGPILSLVVAPRPKLKVKQIPATQTQSTAAPVVAMSF